MWLWRRTMLHQPPAMPFTTLLCNDSNVAERPLSTTACYSNCVQVSNFQNISVISDISESKMGTLHHEAHHKSQNQSTGRQHPPMQSPLSLARTHWSNLMFPQALYQQRYWCHSGSWYSGILKMNARDPDFSTETTKLQSCRNDPRQRERDWEWQKVMRKKRETWEHERTLQKIIGKWRERIVKHVVETVISPSKFLRPRSPAHLLGTLALQGFAPRIQRFGASAGHF